MAEGVAFPTSFCLMSVTLIDHPPHLLNSSVISNVDTDNIAVFFLRGVFLSNLKIVRNSACALFFLQSRQNCIGDQPHAD